MTFLDELRRKAEGIILKVGLGLGDTAIDNVKILKATSEILKFNQSSFLFFGKRKDLRNLARNPLYDENSMVLVDSDDPASEVLHYLNNNKISCVIRGSISSSPFLRNLNIILHISEINRLALLETNLGYQFFFGPVGIDECYDLESKKQFIERALIELRNLNIKPRISVLSGGRLGDVGRNLNIDKSIDEAKELVDYFNIKEPDLEIEHTEILIEKAIKNESNLILAPNGITGNLIYRTLVHLGGGKAYGAIYMGTGYNIIDTSRVGDFSEIFGGIILALALSKR